MPTSMVKKSKTLEQLRSLASGYNNAVIETFYYIINVDAKEKLLKVCGLSASGEIYEN